MTLSKNYLLAILFLFPFTFIIGVAVMEFIVLLSIIFFIFYNKNINIFFDVKIVFLIVFSIYIFFNSYFQIQGEYSKNLRLSSIVHFRFVIFALSIYYFCQFLQLTKKKYFFYILIFFTTILLVDSNFQFFNGKNLLGYEIYYSRISSFFGEELILGSFLVRLLPIILFFFFYLKIDVEKYKFNITIFLTLYLFTIYISGERTSFFLAVFIFLTIILIFKCLRKITFYSTILFIIFNYFISVFEIGKFNPESRMFKKTYNQIVEIKPNLQLNKIRDNNKKNSYVKKYNIFSKDHQGHIELAIDLFMQNKVFGIGPKGFRFHCRKVNYNPIVGICSTHPHNILIQIITELGLIGLIFYIIAGAFVLINFVKSYINQRFNSNFLSFYSITIGLIINLFPLVPSGNFFNNWISIILYYNIGIYLYSYKKCLMK